MSELVSTVRDAVAALAQSDRAYLRFGAAQHRYEFAAPLDEDAVAACEAVLAARLPADYRAFVREVAASGAGPGYGLVPIARPVVASGAHEPNPPLPIAQILRPPLPIAHLGCGYAASLELATGAVVLEARAIGIVVPIYPSFTAFYADWIERLARGQLPDYGVPPGACALAHALGGYLTMCEQRLGLPAGGLAGEPLRAALAELGPNAIAIAADASPLFAAGERVDPCITCARTLANLGLPAGVVSSGLRPLPLRLD